MASVSMLVVVVRGLRLDASCSRQRLPSRCWLESSEASVSMLVVCVLDMDV